MAISAVSICNWALSRIAVSRTINDLEETSQEAATCKLFYDQVRDETLRAWPWPFAMRHAVLALVEENNPAYDWQYAYRMPSGCLRIILIRPAEGFNLTPSPHLGYYPTQYLGPSYDQGQPFEVAGDDQGWLILTNTPEARITYTAQVTDASRFAPDFASCLAWKLAAEIAAPLSQSGSLSDRANREFVGAIARAGATAAAEQYRGHMPEAAHIRERL